MRLIAEQMPAPPHGSCLAVLARGGQLNGVGGHRDPAQHPLLSLLPFSSLPAMLARSGLRVSDEGLPKLHGDLLESSAFSPAAAGEGHCG